MLAEKVDSNDPEEKDLCRLHTLPLKRRLMERQRNERKSLGSPEGRVLGTSTA